MPKPIPTSLPPALAWLIDDQPDWRRPFIDWRVSHEGQLEAIAHTLKNEQVWRLVCDLMESALQTGWAARERSVGSPEEREPELVSVR